MELCDDDHPQICHDEKECPVCSSQQEVEELEDQVKELNGEVDDLSQEVEKLSSKGGDLCVSCEEKL